MTRTARMFLGLGALVACARTTDHHDGGGLDTSTTGPNIDARQDSAPPDARAIEARAFDAGAADVAPLTP